MGFFCFRNQLFEPDYFSISTQNAFILLSDSKNLKGHVLCCQPLEMPTPSPCSTQQQNLSSCHAKKLQSANHNTFCLITNIVNAINIKNLYILASIDSSKFKREYSAKWNFGVTSAIHLYGQNAARQRLKLRKSFLRYNTYLG